MPAVRVRVPATSANLGPGFDTLGVALNLHNFVTVGDAPVTGLTVQGVGAASLSTGDDNIALLAARHLLAFIGLSDKAFHLTLENHIPLARGLGSSAAARVGALVAANQWAKAHGWGGATTRQLVTLATQLEGHPDNVAPALLGGLVASCATEQDGELSALAVRLPVERFPGLVVFVPETELSTSTARAVLPPQVSRADANFNVARTALLLGALATGHWELLREALRDRLHQDARAALVPGFAAVVQAATTAGAYGATLSGAGPSVLAWLPTGDAPLRENVRQSMQNAAAAQGVAGVAQVVEVDLEGGVVV